MSYDEKLVASKLYRWEHYLKEYRLPEWEQIPDIGLYMEQVIALLRGYLDYMPSELKEDQVVTAAAINNYVRKKIMPEPCKKKYYRYHIVYLIIICTMKQCLSIPTLKTLLPPDLSSDELKSFYRSYIRRHRIAADHFMDQMRSAAADIVGREEYRSGFTAESTEELIESVAIMSGFSRLLAEKLLLLDGKSAEENRDDAEKRTK